MLMNLMEMLRKMNKGQEPNRHFDPKEIERALEIKKKMMNMEGYLAKAGPKKSLLARLLA